ncbi:alpha-glucosidase [Pseudomonas sp. NPDC090203]|uniref:alpha-glucosidase n=1 Tax=Pseudomonas sp. NPDC090203 TaxID=3364477 RepID=UPI00381CF266
MTAFNSLAQAGFQQIDDEVQLIVGGRVLLRHSQANPGIFIGHGDASISMQRGNFSITDYVQERIALRHAWLDTATNRLDFRVWADGPVMLSLALEVQGNLLRLVPVNVDAGINRFWLRVPALVDEHVWGCGEQMSYFDLRGRHFPLWTSEPGVGRDKSTWLTLQADNEANAGGDYYHTNYPQPTYISSQRYCLHAVTTAYADFDFRHDDFHELQFWAVPEAFEFMLGQDFPDLVGQVSSHFGRQPRLPEWVMQGAILGLKNGLEHAQTRLDDALQKGVAVSALWCEDWEGLRITSFGKRLFWDWQWNAERYPDHAAWVDKLQAQGIRFMGYVNPYLCNDGPLFLEAQEAGYLATRVEGGTYLVDFGEFLCGVVDFTLPAAAQWFEERILRREMLDKGLSGWMADFGEYLPIDLKLAGDADPMLEHNAWPVRWAEVNARAIEAAGKTGDALFFMRAGYSGVQRHCPLLWAGDQSVDFSRHDGLQTVICGALSSGLLGNAYHHSDIGGYTSLYGNCRTAELFQRWAEMAAFTPVMRTHEGNRPDQNLQFWDHDETYAHFARMTRLYVALRPYLQSLVEEAQATGLPLQRPLFLHYENDPDTYAIQDQYLYGRDLLVAPVHAEGQREWSAYLPQGDQWQHLWSAERFEGGQRVRVAAPLGQPPVFIRVGSAWQERLEALGRNAS